MAHQHINQLLLTSGHDHNEVQHRSATLSMIHENYAQHSLTYAYTEFTQGSVLILRN